MSALYFKKEPGQNGSWPAISRQSFPGFGSWLSSPEHAVLSSRASRAPVRALVSAFPSLQSAAPSGPPWRSHKPPTQFRLRLLARPLHRSEEHTSELQSQSNLVCRLLLEKTNVWDATQSRNGDRRFAASRWRERWQICNTKISGL